MDFLYERITYVFDALQRFWEHERLHRKLAVMLVCFFLGSLLVIELKRQHMLPPGLAALVPANHFFAIGAAFTVILILEVLSLIFVLPCSFSRSIGKQFELLSLILLRDAFKELSHFAEPISYVGNQEAILKILSDGFGALVVFGLLGIYYLVQARAEEKGEHATDLYRFVAAKKGISLLLLGSFFIMGVQSISQTVTGHGHPEFFHNFYTLLIMTDVLIVLISQCFLPSFFSVFRNSGYALSTMIIRLALVAPAYFNVLMGIAAISFAILLTLISSRLFPGR